MDEEIYWSETQPDIDEDHLLIDESEANLGLSLNSTLNSRAFKKLSKKKRKFEEMDKKEITSEENSPDSIVTTTSLTSKEPLNSLDSKDSKSNEAVKLEDEFDDFEWSDDFEKFCSSVESEYDKSSSSSSYPSNKNQDSSSIKKEVADSEKEKNKTKEKIGEFENDLDLDMEGWKQLELLEKSYSSSSNNSTSLPSPSIGLMTNKENQNPVESSRDNNNNNNRRRGRTTSRGRRPIQYLSCKIHSIPQSSSSYPSILEITPTSHNLSPSSFSEESELKSVLKLRLEGQWFEVGSSLVVGDEINLIFMTLQDFQPMSEFPSSSFNENGQEIVYFSQRSNLTQQGATNPMIRSKTYPLPNQTSSNFYSQEESHLINIFKDKKAGSEEINRIMRNSTTKEEEKGSDKDDDIGEIVIDDHFGIVIVHPDILLAPTLITDSSVCERRGVLTDLVGGGIEDIGSEPATLGSLKHELFQRILVHKFKSRRSSLIENEFEEDEFYQQMVVDIVQNSTYQLYQASTTMNEARTIQSLQCCVPLIVSWVHSIIQDHQNSENEVDLVWMHNHMNPSTKSSTASSSSSSMLQRSSTLPNYALSSSMNHNSIEEEEGYNYRISKVVGTEENIWLPILGLKGQIDATAIVSSQGFVQEDDQLNPFSSSFSQDPSNASRKGGLLTAIELKTGKKSPYSLVPHKAQVLLYILLLRLRYDLHSIPPSDEGILLYLPDPLKKQQEQQNSFNKPQKLAISSETVKVCWPELCGLLMVRNRVAFGLKHKEKGLNDVIKLSSSLNCEENKVVEEKKDGLNKLDEYYVKLDLPKNQSTDIEDLTSQISPQLIPTLPPLITSERDCRFCYRTSECMAYLNASSSLDSMDNCPIPNIYESQLGHLKSSMLQDASFYMQKWEKLISYEEIESIKSRIFMWKMDGEQKERISGDCLVNLNLKDIMKIPASERPDLEKTKSNHNDSTIIQPISMSDTNSSVSDDDELIDGDIFLLFQRSSSSSSASFQNVSFEVGNSVMISLVNNHELLKNDEFVQKWVDVGLSLTFLSHDKINIFRGRVSSITKSTIVIKITLSFHFSSHLPFDLTSIFSSSSKSPRSSRSERQSLLISKVYSNLFDEEKSEENKMDEEEIQNCESDDFKFTQSSSSSNFSNPQTSNQPHDEMKSLFSKSIKFRVDKDSFTTSIKYMRQNMIKLIIDIETDIPQDKKRMRDLIIQMKKPRFFHEDEDNESSSINSLSENSSLNNNNHYTLQELMDMQIEMLNEERSSTVLPNLSINDSIVQFPPLKHSRIEMENLNIEFDLELNSDQKGAVSKVLTSQDYSLILGMPGTGKTTTIVFIIRALLACGASVVVSSYTHAAVDNVLLKLKRAGIEDKSMIRIGNKFSLTCPELEENLLQFDSDLSLEEIHDKISHVRLVGVTCLGSRHPLFSYRKFDVCVIDEAGQIIEPICLGPILTSRRFVLIGDHNQLPPLIKSERAQVEGMQESLFKRLCEGINSSSAIHALSIQYRMNEDIMSLANHLIYNHQLTCGSEEVKNQQLNIQFDTTSSQYQSIIQSNFQASFSPFLHLLLSKATDPITKVLFVDLERQHLNSTSTDNGEDILKQEGVVLNEIEADYITQIVKCLLLLGVSPNSIGIISAYRTQVKLLKSCILDIQHPSIQSTQLKAIEVSTVDTYQGRDKDVIFMSFVRWNKIEKSRILRDWRRINVSITRAKKKIIMVGSTNQLKQIPIFQRLIQYVTEKNWIMKISV